MKIFNLLEVKYNQFTSSIRQYLSKALSNSNTTYGNNTVFGQLINVLNATVQNIMLYIEDSLVEQNKYTAQRKKSVYGLASLTGYTPHLGTATGVNIALNYIPTNVDNFNVFINNREQITCMKNGLTYNIILPQEAILLSPDKNTNTKNIYAVQGLFETQTFTSIGGKFYTQNFKFVGNLDVNYLQVEVNDEIWDYCESIYDMNPNGKQWSYKISVTSGIDIVFGNDKYGKSLSDGDTIKITYLIHDGELGNIESTPDVYFVFNNMLKNLSGEDVDGNAIFNMGLASSDSIVSGSNSETIEEVRQMIGLNSRSLVMTSPDNYKNMLNKFSFCGYNRTWSKTGSSIVNSLIIKNYKLKVRNGEDYFNLTENDFNLTDLQKTSLKNYIENTGQQLAGVTYNIFDPILRKYALFIYLKMKTTNYEKSFIENKIRNLIGDFFTDIQSDIFIPKSDIVQLIKNNVPEVDGINVYFMSEQNEKAMQVGWYKDVEYQYNQSNNSYNKKEYTYKLYDGENPNLGLDEHGNIYLKSDEEFPILMGGWDYMNNIDGIDKQEIMINNPLIIVFEN